jgi:hypothetical protein
VRQEFFALIREEPQWHQPVDEPVIIKEKGGKIEKLNRRNPAPSLDRRGSGATDSCAMPESRTENPAEGRCDLKLSRRTCNHPFLLRSPLEKPEGTGRGGKPLDFMAPPGLPQDVAALLSQQLVQIARSPEFQQFCIEQILALEVRDREDLAPEIAKEVTRWQSTVRLAQAR